VAAWKIEGWTANIQRMREIDSPIRSSRPRELSNTKLERSIPCFGCGTFPGGMRMCPAPGPDYPPETRRKDQGRSARHFAPSAFPALHRANQILAVQCREQTG